MSREFHYCYAGYFHNILNDVADSRAISGEPVADAIRDVLIALAPVEYAIASHQANDSGKERVIISCHENHDVLEKALKKLLAEISSNKRMVDDILRDHFRKSGKQA